MRFQLSFDSVKKKYLQSLFLFLVVVSTTATATTTTFPPRATPNAQLTPDLCLNSEFGLYNKKGKKVSRFLGEKTFV